MANSTTNLTTVTQAQSGKEITVNGLVDAASPATLYGRNEALCDGMTWAYYGGNVLIDSTITYIANGTITLNTSSTTYIEANPATGAVSSNTSAFTSNYIKLYEVVTGASTVTSWTDYRCTSNGSTNQSTYKTSSVTFAGITLNGNIAFNGTRTISATTNLDVGSGSNKIVFDASGGTTSIFATTQYTTTVGDWVWTQIAGYIQIYNSSLGYGFTMANTGVDIIIPNGVINITSSDYSTYGGRFYCDATGNAETYGVVSAAIKVQGGASMTANATDIVATHVVKAPSYSDGTNQLLGAQAAAVAAVASADATDLATAITLVNEIKAQFNDQLAKIKTHGFIAS